MGKTKLAYCSYHAYANEDLLDDGISIKLTIAAGLMQSLLQVPKYQGHSPKRLAKVALEMAESLVDEYQTEWDEYQQSQKQKAKNSNGVNLSTVTPVDNDDNFPY